MKQTVQTLQAMKERGEKIAMLTCYDYTMAKLMDAAGTDMLLVGDSLGNVILGYSDTISVTMEDMIHHTAAVSRGAQNALVVADMPFLSYQTCAFALVMECVPAKLAALVTKTLHIPTIGIGAGAGCDGQVLVYQDMLGMFMDYQPKFVRKFAEVGKTMQDAFVTYRNEIQAGNFPAEEHSFAISDEVMAQLEQEAQA